MNAIPPVPDPEIVARVMDPHVELACSLLMWALLVIAIGWAIDVMIAAWRKNREDR